MSASWHKPRSGKKDDFGPTRFGRAFCARCGRKMTDADFGLVPRWIRIEQNSVELWICPDCVLPEDVPLA